MKQLCSDSLINNSDNSKHISSGHIDYIDGSLQNQMYTLDNETHQQCHELCV